MDRWRDELGALLKQKVAEDKRREAARREQVTELVEKTRHFYDTVVVPAFEELSKELEKEGRSVYMDVDPDHVSMTVTHRGEVQFKYSVKQIGGYPSATMLFSDTGVVSSGLICPKGKDYRAHKVASTTKEDIIADFMDRLREYVQSS